MVGDHTTHTVSPFNVTKDNASKVRVLLDEDIVSSKMTYAVHALSASETVFVTGAGIQQYLETTQVQLDVVPFSSLKAPAPAAPAAKPEPKAKAVDAKIPEAEQEHIRKTVMEKEGMFVDVLDLLRRVPRAMLMVLKINDLTRSLDANLHTTHGPARPFIITARYCALAVHRNDEKKLKERWRSDGMSLRLVRDYTASWWSYLYFYQGLMLMERCSDVVASVRKYFVYLRTLCAVGFDTQAAHRAAAGLDDQARSEEKEAADRSSALLALQSDSADTLAEEADAPTAAPAAS